MEAVRPTFVLSSPQDMTTLSQCTESVCKTDMIFSCELNACGIFLYKNGFVALLLVLTGPFE